ncbi:hypothetical protein [Xanthovirga aplysinae]|uniref:hypothetical protein n=1 Tax=Xanthovirga aplysinae TaxID=2529853 RepID=UPI0012BCAB69|nr:hypothetical protein [Xanthovirga aplysinae]MTI32277.1 hypothetical protein [Xanthovirga aplysinae]
MRRVQLFEFEDFHWFPSSFRSTMTKIIVVFHQLLGTKEVIANLLSEIRKNYGYNRIVDMGSGSGGAMPMVIEHLNKVNKGPKVELLLTDLHPNKKFIDQFNGKNQDYISYSETPLDAKNLSQAPKGMKTMINSFHHMPPFVAREILRTAQENKQAVLIYEMGENVVPVIIWGLLLPITLPIVALTAILFVPFVKPLNWKDILFTWFIPVVPLFYAWDGQASAPRIYTFKDIEELLPEKNDGYKWEVKHALKKNGKKQGYYILGLPHLPYK